MKFKANLIMLCILIELCIAKGQSTQVNPKLLKGSWPAYWITHPNTYQREYGIYHFRKKFTLSTVPSSFLINVSADNRYRLFVNGKPASSGPARGDLFNWYYETVNIAPLLKQGENTLAAIVWNMGELAAVGQISNQTGFLLQGNSDTENIANTNKSWKVFKNLSYSPCSKDNGERLKAYMVVGPGDQVNANKYPWGWEETYYNDASWESAGEIAHPEPVGYGTDNRWTLVPRNIPLFQEHMSRFSFLRRATGISISSDFMLAKNVLKISSGQTVSILLDNSVNTAAYPELIVSKGKDATIKLTYAESLFDKHGIKGNRNEVENKEIKGNFDVFIPDGGENRKFRPLWIRAYRYLQLDITTNNK
jgi:alpha-L-rhamnosidase